LLLLVMVVSVWVYTEGDEDEDGNGGAREGCVSLWVRVGTMWGERRRALWSVREWERAE
jgi:hypothetical protein